MEEIKAGDVMLNNWVEYDGKYYQISALSEEYPFLNTDAFGVGVVTYRNIKGIHLTDDILVKAGATPYTAKDIFILGNIIIDIKLGIVMLDCIDYTPLLCKCKYLHTFQNIVKLLTGNDLKIEV